MGKYKAYVKVPADSSGKLKRIVTKTVEASNPTDALASLRGQYGTKSVNIASQVMPGRRSFRPSSTSRTYVPRTPSYSRKKYSYKYAKPVSKSSSSETGGAIGVGIGILAFIFIYFLFMLFNYFSKNILATLFGAEKYSYWYKNNKHTVAFVLCTMNLIMFSLLSGVAFNYWFIGIF